MAQELRCSECDYLIDVCGKCNCYQAFALSDLDQSQRDYYRAQFLELITYIKRLGVPNLSPENRDYYELQRIARIASQGDGIISAIDYNVRGVNIHLGPQYFEFMETKKKESSISSDPQVGESSNSAEPQVGEGSNSGSNGEGHKTASVSYPNIDKAGLDNSAKEVNNTSLSIVKNCRSVCPVEVNENKDNLNSRSVLLLRLRLTSIFQHQYLVLHIVRGSLDWKQILHDMESNTLELRWTFYKTVIDYGEGHSGDEEDEEYEYENENENRRPPATAVSAIENLGTQVISHEQVVSGDALCSICKDMIPVGEEAKELPCRHLHHSKCITRWLNVSNFCPLCRYEMPTEDP